MNRFKTVSVLVAVVFAAACSDSTVLDPIDSEMGKPNPALTELGAWIQGATLWVTPALADPVNRGQLESSIKSLAGHLTANKTDDIRSDIAHIRGIINSGSMDDIIAMGPIEVALYTIEDAMGT